jgi:hypothetical protein
VVVVVVLVEPVPATPAEQVVDQPLEMVVVRTTGKRHTVVQVERNLQAEPQREEIPVQHYKVAQLVQIVMVAAVAVAIGVVPVEDTLNQILWLEVVAVLDIIILHL